MGSEPRLKRLREKMKEEELEAMLISSPENRRYFSGFAGSAGYLLVTPSDAVLATDFRYVEQAGQQAPGYTIKRITGRLDWFPELVEAAGVSNVGFEADDVTVAQHERLMKALDKAGLPEKVSLTATSTDMDWLRAGKYEDEMALLLRAIEITDRAFEEVAPTIRPGVTEAEVAWAIEKSMREQGAEGLAFDTIVGAGRNGALPHHRADDTVIQDGDPVVIDMGAKYEGYCADLTRTIVVGEPDETFRRVYGTVLEAQLTAEEVVEPGMTGAEVDAISRDIIGEAGHWDDFGHSLGHGVGLAVHESPTLGPNSSDSLENDMVFTIEPGIYLPEWGGVRIEDMVILENGRARVLSKASKLDLGP